MVTTKNESAMDLFKIIMMYNIVLTPFYREFLRRFFMFWAKFRVYLWQEMPYGPCLIYAEEKILRLILQK